MKKLRLVVLCAGIAMIAAGILLSIFSQANENGALTGILTGFGAGLTSVSIVRMVNEKKLDKNPELAKAVKINETDERNVRIREKAGYASWYFTMFMLLAIAMVLLVLDYDVGCWIALGAMLLHNIAFFAFQNYYNKKL